MEFKDLNQTLQELFNGFLNDLEARDCSLVIGDHTLHVLTPTGDYIQLGDWN